MRSSPSWELSAPVPVCALWLMLTLPSSPWVKATENRTAFHIVCVCVCVCVCARARACVRACMCVCDSLSFVTPWTVVHQSPLSMEFSKQEYWSGLPIPYREDLPDPGIEPESPALQMVSLLSEPWGEPTPHGSNPNSLSASSHTSGLFTKPFPGVTLLSLNGAFSFDVKLVCACSFQWELKRNRCPSSIGRKHTVPDSIRFPWWLHLGSLSWLGIYLLLCQCTW